MGFFTNIFNKAKGVLGRIWDTGKKIVPKVAGVLSRVADLPIIRDLPFVSTINKVYKYGKNIYDTVTGSGNLKDKIKDVSDDVVDVIDVIKGAPSLNDNINAARDSANKLITQEVKPHLNDSINKSIINPVMKKLKIG